MSDALHHADDRRRDGERSLDELLRPDDIIDGIAGVGTLGADEIDAEADDADDDTDDTDEDTDTDAKDETDADGTDTDTDDDATEPDDDTANALGGDGADDGDAAADPTPKRPMRDPLAVQVLRLANRVHGQLKEWKRTDLGARITAEADQWSQQELVVVACGDIKRGKSSLLNAILDRSDLLPVDADVATSVHLVIRYGEELGIVVTRIGEDGEPAQERVGIADLVDVASMRGNAARREGVVSVEISADHPVLERGVVLIDTPGVGGMSRGHRDLALAALGRADALLFTISAEEPVAKSELEFLVEASERTERIILVVTKSDANSEAVNGEMIAEHRAKVRTYADTLQSRVDSGLVDADVPDRLRRLGDTPFVLTSSFLASQARRRREAGREEQAAQLMARSGIDDLRMLLERSSDNRDLIRVANLIALLRSVLADVDRELQARLRASSGDGQVAEDLAELQRTLEQFASKQARWRTTLNNSIARLQTGSSRLVTHELNRVKEHYREIIETTADSEALAESMPAELERSLHGAWNQLLNSINQDFRSTLGTLLADLGADGMDAALGEFEMPETLRDLAAFRASPRGASSFLEDGLPAAMQTFTFANIAKAAVGAVSTGGLGLVAYGIGAAIALPLSRMKKRSRDRQRMKAELQRHVNELLFGQEGVAKEFGTELSLRIIDLREQVELFVEQRLVERRKQLEHEGRELQNLLKAESGKRQEAQKAATARMAQTAKLRTEIEPLQRAVDQRLVAASPAVSIA